VLKLDDNENLACLGGEIDYGPAGSIPASCTFVQVLVDA